MKLPKIEALDLRSKEGRLRAGLLALQRLQEAFHEIWVSQQAWIEWEEISWEDTRHSGRVEFSYWRVLKKRMPDGSWASVNEEQMGLAEIREAV